MRSRAERLRSHIRRVYWFELFLLVILVVYYRYGFYACLKYRGLGHHPLNAVPAGVITSASIVILFYTWADGIPNRRKWCIAWGLLGVGLLLQV